jgi:hypothetical protein
MPYLVGVGQFGDRYDGGIAGSSRYISVIMNIITKFIFPPEDKYLLEYRVDEGKMYEPFYVPTIPMAILESYCIPATGWKVEIWARDLDATINAIFNYIDKNTLPDELPMYVYPNFKGSYRQVGSTLYCVGSYKFISKTNTLIIDELPLGITPMDYFKSLKKREQKRKEMIKGKVNKAATPKKAAAAKAAPKKAATKKAATAKKAAPVVITNADNRKLGPEDGVYIEDMEEYSYTDVVKIEIKFKPGGAQAIMDKYGNEDFDAFEDFFGLKKAVHHQLNFMRNDLSVIEFKSYIDIFKVWFEARKELYKKRLSRECVIIDLKIKMLKNIVRFVDMFIKLNVVKKSKADIEMIAFNNKFDKFNHTLLKNPAFTPVDDMANIICNGPDSKYDYLLNIKVHEFSIESNNENLEKIKKLEEELAEIKSDCKPFIGANTWKKEITAFHTTYKKGWMHLLNDE